MKYLLLLWLLFPLLLRGQEYQLAPPKIYADSIFFLQNARVTMAFDLEDASIHFTTDGSMPVRHSTVYEAPFSVAASTTIQAVSDHPHYVMSKMASLELVRAGFVPDSARLLARPDSAYRGKSPDALFDLQKGSNDLHDGRWLGFRGDTVVVEAAFPKTVQCRQIVVSTLSDPGAWIFPPRSIEVYGMKKGGRWQLLGKGMPRNEPTRKNRTAVYALYEAVDLDKTEADRIRVKVVPYGNLPEGHPGAGSPAWLFLDEVIFQ